ncbi:MULTISPECIES: hypothetical protein [Vibrio]|jgi:Asp-tRNA(Asn)/Glu-tRNA(Gln) amidotransferase B subunit|uniref:Uncharacterized protein n=1 Tax=Vibrio celticus TaxID=446372 RepID=A0A1C3JL13_9VIBR|nr:MULTISPECIES: hypothetical protein [Vibrio]MDH6025996.1 hypothetical protein [Vibrio splendidus]SBT15870.1 hypothetical protein VCE7224_04685 [Vibrio celticus]
MSFWKVLGGACAGVAAVVALPVAGPIGAVTAVGAAVAAGVGAAAGGVAEYYDDSESESVAKGKRMGKQEAEASKNIEMEKLRDELASKLSDIEARENFLVTAFAVGVCAANADHEICGDEREELEVLVAGIGKSNKLSQATKDRVEEWFNNPPNLNTVWELIKKNGLNTPEDIAILDTVIKMVIWADDEQNDHEVEFIDAWNSLVA